MKDLIEKTLQEIDRSLQGIATDAKEGLEIASAYFSDKKQKQDE